MDGSVTSTSRPSTLTGALALRATLNWVGDISTASETATKLTTPPMNAPA